MLKTVEDFGDVGLALLLALEQIPKPLIGPLVGTELVMGGIIDIRRVSLHDRIAPYLPLHYAPFLEVIRAMPDGKGGTILLLHHLIRHLAESSCPLNPDISVSSRHALLDAWREGGVVMRIVDDTMHSLRYDLPEFRCDGESRWLVRCVEDVLSSRLSLSLSKGLALLVVDATRYQLLKSSGCLNSRSLSRMVTFSECRSSIVQDSSFGSSFGFMLGVCYRSSRLGPSSGCVLKVPRLWFGVTDTGESSDSSDEDGAAYDLRIDDEDISREAFDRFINVIEGLAQRDIRLVVTPAVLSRWMVNRARDRCHVHLVHGVDEGDVERFMNETGVGWSVAGSDGITVAQDGVFTFSSCQTVGHSSASDKQYLEVEGLRVGDVPFSFLHIRVPSARLIPLYRSYLTTALEVASDAVVNGCLAGGGSCLNTIGNMLVSTGMKESLLPLTLLGSALRFTALELTTSKQGRRAMMLDSSVGIHVSSRGLVFRSARELCGVDIVVPFSVVRATIANALKGICSLLQVSAAVTVKSV